MSPIKAFFQSILHAVGGISLEILLTYLFILLGLGISLFWWGVIR